ncbi:DUF58 domain-containing protein [Gimesia fumaroli]|uniref:VWA domain containing CoxE-like protein n=1 Tax=Gimesia fumaroli TaxID=2527976 RepID=A0A518ID15_9PLAN|nr:DUF58 domain-containing protein [Gimesia fumaroli]QDV50944.1 VWA domain containing CoxE-like protein [Gimesia fumaroli]
MKEYLNPEIVGRIAGIGFKARQPVEGSIAGLHRSPLHGLSPEFADYRSYTPGDDLKNLDWKAYARSDRFYIKRFEEESNLRAVFIVDSSKSMAYGGPAFSKFDCAASIAVSMSAVLLKQRDAVGLAILNDRVQQDLRTGSTPSHLAKFIEVLQQVELQGETDIGPAVSQVADQIHRRGVVVVLSDLLTPLDPFYEALGKLQHAGHEIIVGHILHRDEVEMQFKDSVIFKDIEGEEEIFAEPWAFHKAYQAAMEEFIQETRQRCQYCGIDYLQIMTDENLGGVLSSYLHNRQFAGAKTHRGRMSSLGSQSGDDNKTESVTANSPAPDQ